VEKHRIEEPWRARVAGSFAEWGIPTAECLRAARAAAPDAVLLASGSIRHDLAAVLAHRTADEIGEPHREPGCRLVTTLRREARVPADVRNQEGMDPDFHAHILLRYAAHPRRAIPP